MVLIGALYVVYIVVHCTYVDPFVQLCVSTCTTLSEGYCILVIENVHPLCTTVWVIGRPVWGTRCEVLCSYSSGGSRYVYHYMPT